MMNRSVVVFDDEIDIRELLRYNLTKEGFNVITFPSPLYGYDFIKEHIPDIILCDWLMPDIDGIEFCKELKKNDTLQHVPIIMISCRSSESDIVTAFRTGALDYVVKPFRMKELVARINRIIKNRTEYVS
jgi:DNA-binding response OmpR family regulator